MTNRHTIYVNCIIALSKLKTSLMGFAHLSGREPLHPEKRDQMGQGLFHIKIWTLESLAFLCIGVVNYGDRYRPVYCFVSSQAGFQTHCHWDCFKKAFNINDLALIVMDWLCRDTLPSRAQRDKPSF